MRFVIASASHILAVPYRPYFPRKLGGRLARNAFMPSF